MSFYLFTLFVSMISLFAGVGAGAVSSVYTKNPLVHFLVGFAATFLAIFFFIKITALLHGVLIY